MTNKELKFTNDELIILGITIQDLAHYGEVEPKNGLKTNRIYLTPYTCYCLSNILKKVNDYLDEVPSAYMLEYKKLRAGTNKGE